MTLFSLFKSLQRAQLGCLSCGLDPEKNPHEKGKSETERKGLPGYGCGDDCKKGQHRRDKKPQKDSYDPAATMTASMRN